MLNLPAGVAATGAVPVATTGSVLVAASAELYPVFLFLFFLKRPLSLALRSVRELGAVWKQKSVKRRKVDETVKARSIDSKVLYPFLTID